MTRHERTQSPRIRLALPAALALLSGFGCGSEAGELSDDPECGNDMACLQSSYHALLECSAELECPKSQITEDPGQRRWSGADCVLTALRDRVPGLYEHVNTFADLGSTSTTTRFLITDSGEVLRGGMTESALADGSAHRSNFSAAERCAAKPAAYFQDCTDTGTELTGVGGTGGPPVELDGVCDHVADWFESCIPSEPACN
jgi:hypothetical protein